MADDNGGWWKRVRDELVSPWDWVVAGIGATGGLIVSAAVLHGDLGASVGAGALGAVTAKQAGVAAYQQPILKKRTRAFIRVIEKELENYDKRHRYEEFNILLENIKRDYDLLNNKVIGSVQYGKVLDDYINEYRKIGSR